jgi:hypothetical protein
MSTGCRMDVECAIIDPKVLRDELCVFFFFVLRMLADFNMLMP